MEQFFDLDFGIISDKLYLPVNKQAILRLGSADVIHSFWVPEFRVKQDALPGGSEFVRDLRITPTRIGEYKVRCAELCGLQHAYMTAPVIVVLLLFSKIAADFRFLTKAAQTFTYALSKPYLPVASLLHIPYVLYFGLKGNLNKFEWGGLIQKTGR